MKKTLVALACSTVLAGCSQPRAAVNASGARPVAQARMGVGTLCRNGEMALFSCGLASSRKVASLCASKGLSAEHGHVYYAFGTPTKVELHYPQDLESWRGLFQRTHLVYAGPTGAFAYSFMHAGVEYVLYSISGANGLERQGVLAYRPGAPTPLVDLKCAEGALVEPQDPGLTDFTLTWPENPALAEHGLPF